MPRSQAQIKAWREAGMCWQCGAPAAPYVKCGRCREGERSFRGRKRERLVRTKPLRDLETGYAYLDATLGEIATELDGISRERVRQIESYAFRKLLSRDHRKRIEWRLDGAISRRKAAREASDLREELRAVTEVDELLDALDWLEGLQNGELESFIVERMQQGGELGRYEGSSALRNGTHISAWGGGR